MYYALNEWDMCKELNAPRLQDQQRAFKIFKLH
jgi:hypothetical protein